jgi:hypothetical protein
VAAAPLCVDIAVPVEAVPSAITADVVMPAAAKPPNVPNAAPVTPPARTAAPTVAFLSSLGVNLSSFTLAPMIFSILGLL